MKNCIVIFYLLICFTGVAQPPSPYFERITTQNGLSNNQVNCILQDKRGFLWIGTNDGLNRYDGNHFLIFRNRPGDSTSLSGNMITDLVEDKEGILWIATSDGGISRYDYKLQASRQFKQYKSLPGNKNSIPTNGINKLLEDKNNFLWLASNGYALIRFNKATEKFDRPVTGGPKTVLDLKFDYQGIIWAGRQGGGILKINPITLQSESDRRYQDLYTRLPHVVVTSLFSDSKKIMWYGSWDKVLYKYDPVSKLETAYQQQNGFINDEVTSFAEDRLGRLWIGGKVKGLQLFDKSVQQFYNYQHIPSQEGSIADNGIRCIYVDKTDKIWIGTSKGISINNPSQQQFVQTFLPATGSAVNEVSIYDFYKDEKGDLWIGTSAGIYLQKKDTRKIIYKPLSYKGNLLSVSKFFMGSNGVFYIGTNYSLFIYNRGEHTIQLLPNTEKDQVMNKIIASRVVSITEDTIDGNPVVIVSPYGHFLAYYDFVAQQWVSRRDSAKNIIEKYNIKDNLIRKFYKTSTGNIWLANVQEGVGEWINNSLPRIQFYKNDPFQKEGLSNNNVYDITEDRSQNLWISTYGGGLNYINAKTKKINHIPATNNLLEGIAVDNKENIWMVTNGNLQLYNINSKSSSSFHVPDLEKTGGITGYIYKDNEGNLYVAGKNFFLNFNPNSISDIRREPEIFLTEFKIFNDSYGQLLTDKTIRLGYSQNYFTLEFSAPDYSQSEPIQYSYMLEGWDKEWVNNGTRNFATFSNLEGGSYTFRVRATNNPGTWSQQEKKIRIIIIPPFWKQWWFFAICAIVIAGIIYAIYRYRINELVKRQGIRNKIAQDLHDSVGSTLSSISVYSQVAKIYKEKKQETELQKILEKISDTSGEMISEMNDIVWAINPRNDNMEKIFHRMESFAKPLLQTKNVAFGFRHDESLLHINLSMEKRKNFYLIFKESINNALKYSDCKKLEVSITLYQQHINLKVKDDGKGFDIKEMKIFSSKSLSGNGLNNMKRRADEMKGECFIESAPGLGTSVNLRFPVT